MDGPVECLKVLPCVDINHRPHVTFLGPKDAWRKTAHKYKHLFEMDTKLAYDWLTFWVNANHPNFKECTIDESEDVQTKMKNVTNEIVQEAITTENPDIVGMSTALDAEDEEENSGMNSIDHKSATPYTIHTAVLPKPSLINASINAAIDALCKIVQPEDNSLEDNNHLDDENQCDTDSNFRPVIPVSRESNEPIVEWTDNDKLLRGAFPDLFLFGQGIPNQLPTHRHWKHFALYYDGRFDNPLFIAHGFNQLQRASCIRTSARITGKNAATLSSLGILANSEAFRKQLVWARDHPNSKTAKSLNAKLSRILSMVGSAIPYSPFERAATRPKLNAMRYRYGVGSNFLTGAPGEFEDLMTLRLCLNPKFNRPFCYISQEGFTRDDLPYRIRNDTAIRIRLTKLRPLLEAEYFHHKLNIFLKAVIGCKTSSETRRSHDYLEYERRAYHRIAALNGVIEPQRDGRLHWHIMIYSSVLSPELLQKAAISPIKVQEQIGQTLDSITCTTLPLHIHKWYNDIISSIKPGEKRPRAADIGVPDASLYYTDFVDIAMKKSLWLGMHGHGFSCEKGKKGKYMCRLVFKRGLHNGKTCLLLIILFRSEQVEKKIKADLCSFPLDEHTIKLMKTPIDALTGWKQHS